MSQLIDQLPPEIAAQIHPDWRRNEARYWAQREGLLADYRDQWIGFADGNVIATGQSPVDVFHRALELAPHAYFTCVGRENEPCIIRRSSFAYDSTYPGEPLPIMQVEFRSMSGATGVVFDRVIADTGADATVLPWTDCQTLQLTPTAGQPSMIGGVGGVTSATISFRIWVFLDGSEHNCRVQADFTGRERILGRDVLSRMDVLFRGPSREVVVNP